MEVVRFVFRALLLALALGLTVEFAVPGGATIVDVATAAFAAATWIVPPAIVARHWNRWPKVSLQGVGIWIAALAFAMSLSAMTIALAILTFIFAGGGDWAVRSLAAVAAFWIAAPIALYAGSRFEKMPEQRDRVQRPER